MTAPIRLFSTLAVAALLCPVCAVPQAPQPRTPQLPADIGQPSAPARINSPSDISGSLPTEDRIWFSLTPFTMMDREMPGMGISALRSGLRLDQDTAAALLARITHLNNELMQRSIARSHERCANLAAYEADSAALVKSYLDDQSEHSKYRHLLALELLSSMTPDTYQAALSWSERRTPHVSEMDWATILDNPRTRASIIARLGQTCNAGPAAVSQPADGGTRQQGAR